METIFVKPARNLKITVPVNGSYRFLSEDGEPVPRNTYWLRRIKEGDVVESTENESISEVDND
jgi:hypothetical protein